MIKVKKITESGISDLRTAADTSEWFCHANEMVLQIKEDAQSTKLEVWFTQLYLEEWQRIPP